jgi:Calx-beta domain
MVLDMVLDPAAPLAHTARTRLRFATSGVSVTEGSVASLLVVRDGPSGGTISVQYATVPGTATADVDYTSVSGELVFPPGVTSQAIQVPTRRDLGNEPSETLSVQISSPSPGVVLGTPSSAVVTILNATVILILR